MASSARTTLIRRLPQQHRLQDRFVNNDMHTNTHIWWCILVIFREKCCFSGKDSSPVLDTISLTVTILPVQISYKPFWIHISKLGSTTAWLSAVRNANTVIVPGRCHVSSDCVCVSDGQALDWAAQWGPVGCSTACGF